MADSLSADADRGLLFAALALQADLLDRVQFAEACTAWLRDRSGSLPDFLVAGGWMTAEGRAEVERLLRRRLDRDGGDARAGLAAATCDDVRQALAAVADLSSHPTLGVTPEPIPPTCADDADAPPGTVAETPAAPRADRYTRTRLHAAGGIGQVWLARDEELGREVALKELRPDRHDQPALWARFVREARVTGQLEHPGIVPVYELARPGDGRRPYYTMRFVRGRTLAEAFRDYQDRRRRGGAGPLELHALLSAFVSICQAVAYAHSRGVLHRDLKPHNIVLGDFGEVVVLDWGLAKLIDAPDDDHEATIPLTPSPAGTEAPATLAGAVLGTPAYMAPEQAEGRPDLVDRRTDVYSLGVILYELLTGRLPFEGTDTAQLLRRVRQGEPTPPRHANPEVPPALAAVCLRALARDRDGRYGSAAALAQEVQRWLADEPVEAYAERWPRRLARWARRHQAAVATAAGVLLTVAAALGIGLALLGREQARTEHARQQAEDNAAAARLAEQKATESATLARAAEVRAEDHARSAVAQRQLALETLQILVTDVQEQLEDKPDTHDLKEALLTAALTGLDRVAHKAGDDARADLNAAEAHQRMGEIFLVLGKLDRAQRELEQGRDKADALVRADANNRDARRQHAAAQRRLAAVRARNGQVAEARKLLLDSREKLLALLGEDDRDAKAQHELAEALCDLGDAGLELGETAAARDYFRESLRVAERRHKADAKSEEGRLDLAAAQVGLAQASLHLGEVEEAGRWSAQALEGLEKLEADGKKGAKVKRGQAAAARTLGDVRSRLGKKTEARDLYARGLKLIQGLSAADPKNGRLRRDLSVAHNILGDVLTELGELGEACSLFEKSIAIMQELVEKGQTVRDKQDLASSYLRLGHAMTLRGKPVEARTLLEKCPSLLKIVVEADQKNAEARRDLTMVYQQLGGVCATLNDSTRARQYFEQCVELTEKLVADDPKSAKFRRDLAVAYNKLGDLLGRVEPARVLPLYEKSREQALAVLGIDRTSRQAQYDVAMSHLRIGDARLKLGHPKEARADCLEALKLLEAVTDADAKNLQMRRDLGHAHLVLGKVAVALGEVPEARKRYAAGIGVFEKLVKADPKMALLKTDLLTAYNVLGDLVLPVNPREALGLYEKSLEQALAVLKLDAKSGEAQYNAALSHLRVASVRLQLGKPKDARPSCLECMEILRPLAADDGKNTEPVRDLACSYQVLAKIHQALDEPGPARTALAEALSRFEAIHAKAPKDLRARRDLLTTRNQLGDLCLQRLNDRATAREQYQKSFKIAEELAAAEGADTISQYDLVVGRARLAMLAIYSAEPEEGLKHLKEAETLRDRLEKAGKLKGTGDYLPSAAQLREYQEQCRMVQKAADDLDFVLKQSPSTAAQLLILRVQMLSRRGKHAEAAATTEKLAERVTKNPRQRLALARCQALCAAAVGQGKKEADWTNDEKEARAKYTTAALEELQKAVEVGLKDAALLEADNDLEAVRGAEGFRKLMGELKKDL
jgi:tetratricopeptide (TPR) repeat protein/tRNA A-37 threonylcarbamoyl transferase component Bud32